MMEWIPCTECIYVDEDCVEARRADGCYCGEREESLKDSVKLYEEKESDEEYKTYLRLKEKYEGKDN